MSGEEAPFEDVWRHEGGPPDFVAARDHVRESLVRFARSLRRAGAEVPANAATEAARALVEAGFEADAARAATRATMITREEDLAVFERQFPQFWDWLSAGLDTSGPADRPADPPDGGLAPLGGSAAAGETPDSDPDTEARPDDGDPEPLETALRSDPGGAQIAPEPDDGEGATVTTYSPVGRRETVSVPPTLLDGDGIAGPMRELTRALASLRGRRFARDGDDELDARRALRASFSTGGTVLSVPRRGRAPAGVRALLLVDVSQSVLDVLDRGFLLSVLHRAAATWRQTRIFFFDEGVSEVTDAFGNDTVSEALSALRDAETEWGGGTQIGRAVDTVRSAHPDAVDRRTTAFVISDGLEVGDVAELRRGMAWLSRRAGSVLWLNPLAAGPEYEPAARGMAAALPYVDGLFAFAGPDDLAEIARQLRLRGTGGTLGYEVDPRRSDGPGSAAREETATVTPAGAATTNGTGDTTTGGDTL